MTGFIYICRLRMIESRIQQSIYRVDQSCPATKDEVEKFIQQLDEWRESMPIDARNGEVPRLETMIMDGYDHYVSPSAVSRLPRKKLTCADRWCTTTSACASSSTR